jgi:XrtN system VIT domain protein
MKTTVTSDAPHFEVNSDAFASRDSVISFDRKLPFWIDFDYLIGIGVLMLSTSLFLGNDLKNNRTAFLSGYFAFNYLLAIGYSLWLLVHGKLKLAFWKKQKQKFTAHLLLLWVIWLVSCFALNREMRIFHESADWLSAAIVVSCSVCILYAWKDFFSPPLLIAMHFLLGASTVLWGYYTIYLGWLYPLSIPGIFLFGLTLHSFIPLLFFIAHCRILIRQWQLNKIPMLAGIAIPVLFTIYFCVQWYMISYKIRYSGNEIIMQTNDELPAWTVLGQEIGNDWITKKVIEGNLVYQMPLSEFSFLPLGSNFFDLNRHDPLVFIAALLGPKTELSQKERMNLLDVLYDARHYTQERLWSGKDLKTGNVVTQIKIYPEYRIAYTEKTINVENHFTNHLNQQEALYSFHLPEGSVVSSLSLWINGSEEKAYMTSQSKADSAYKTIVGVESRDPSVVHWQEGNTVKIKVFPCTPEESRKFKIGITSPLKAENNRLVYENIYFQGPASDDATETIRVDFSKNPKNVSLPFRSERNSNTTLKTQGKYRPDWQLRFDNVPVATDGFSFNGKSYTVSEYRERNENFKATAIYLDLNAAWTEKEFKEIDDVLSAKPVFVYDDVFIRLTASNKMRMFRKLNKKRYSVFPVHKIGDPLHSLLITKGTPTSPTFKDLQTSTFGIELKNKVFTAPVRTFNIGKEFSPFFKSLAEFRVVRSIKTDLKNLKIFLIRNEFPEDPESDKILRIPDAEILITESSEPNSGRAPDHLLRLFAYNHIMKQIGSGYLDQGFMKSSALNSMLVEEASNANVVTPVSSLIVLESKADYQRFDIQKSKNNLDNATLKNSGAVPEPHEWALIILFFILATYYTLRSYAR